MLLFWPHKYVVPKIHFHHHLGKALVHFVLQHLFCVLSLRTQEETYDWLL